MNDKISRVSKSEVETTPQEERVDIWRNHLVKRQFGVEGEVFVAGSRVFAPISASLGEAYLTTTSQLGIHQNTVGKSRTNQNMVEKSRNTSKYGRKIRTRVKIR